jgi:uncharacterized membrane protein YhiD involved in acid resistance
MLDQLFETGDYYDFPSFEVALYSLLLAFVLSTIIALTYKFTFVGDRFPNGFFQAMVLSSMVSAMVIMAVGNNLAAGFGIIGAIAIIRFRTNISEPRNVIFIFAALSVGVATGVYGYAIALAGTLIFSIVAVLLYVSPFGQNSKIYLDLTLAITEESDILKVKSLLNNKEISYNITQFRQGVAPQGNKYTFRILVKIDEDQELLFSEVSQLENYADVRLSPSQEPML